MTHQVALADVTYDRLKREKQPGESFSQVIERLLAQRPLDPTYFARHARRISKEEAARRLADIEWSRDQDLL